MERGGEDNDWKVDEAAFLGRFGIPYRSFTMIIMDLFSPAQRQQYERLFAVDEKAAILWAIDEANEKRLIVADEDQPEFID